MLEPGVGKSRPFWLSGVVVKMLIEAVPVGVLKKEPVLADFGGFPWGHGLRPSAKTSSSSAPAPLNSSVLGSADSNWSS